MNSPFPEANKAASAWDNKYENAVQSAWTQNHIVAMEMNKRATGSYEKHWLDWFFDSYLTFRPKSVLSIGCGDGGHEILMARKDYADSIVGFDASPSGVAHANQLAQAEKLSARFYVQYFEEFAANPPSEKFDLVVFAGSLHHVKDIEGVLFATQKSLNDGGLVLVNEYVGPSYQIYSPMQLELINTLLRIIDRRYLVRPNAQVELPTINMVYDNDPTEGVRAPLIPQLLPLFFEPVFERYMGGALLHSLFDGLNGAAINDGSAESERAVRSLIAIEDMLTSAGVISHNFLFGCYKHKI